MSSKGRNPVVAVIKYFEEAPLDAAQAALALAKRVVGVRAEKVVAVIDRRKAGKRRGRKPGVVKAGAEGGAVTQGAAASLVPARTRRQASTAAADGE